MSKESLPLARQDDTRIGVHKPGKWPRDEHGRYIIPNRRRDPHDLTDARTLLLLERRAYSMALRKAGATYRQIAEEVIRRFGRENLPKSYDERYAYRDIRAEINRLRRQIETDLFEWVVLQVERYESIIRAHWPKAMKGHLGATDRVLRAMAQESKLFGLDAPQKFDIRVQQIDRTIERELARLAELAGRRQTGAPSAAANEARLSGESVVEGSFRPCEVD